jgi:hypothetical protein
MVLAHCILGTFLGVDCHCFPPPLDVPTFSASRPTTRETPSSVRWNSSWARNIPTISSTIQLPPKCRDLLHAANLRHGTDGFTSPPKEGVFRIFSPLKIRRLRPGLNPRTWVPKANTLPLDHRSRYTLYIHTLNIYIHVHKQYK